MCGELKIKIKTTIQNVGKNNPWIEILEVSSRKTAEAEIKSMIKKFNDIEEKRYGNSSELRELVSIGEVVKELKPQKIKPLKFKTDLSIENILCKNCSNYLKCLSISPCKAYVTLEENMEQI